MECQGFLAGYTEYQDGLLSEEESGLFEQHQHRCPSCARYSDVLSRSRAVVRQLPTIEVSPDFRASLDARIREEQLFGRLARGPQGSATNTAALAAVAIVFVIIAWLPTLEPVVIETSLPAIAAAPPIRPAVRARLGSTPFPRVRGAQQVVRDEFWGDANALLHEYSTLASGYSASSTLMVRTLGFE